MESQVKTPESHLRFDGYNSIEPAVLMEEYGVVISNEDILKSWFSDPACANDLLDRWRLLCKISPPAVDLTQQKFVIGFHIRNPRVMGCLPQSQPIRLSDCLQPNNPYCQFFCRPTAANHQPFSMELYEVTDGLSVDMNGNMPPSWPDIAALLDRDGRCFCLERTNCGLGGGKLPSLFLSVSWPTLLTVGFANCRQLPSTILADLPWSHRHLRRMVVDSTQPMEPPFYPFQRFPAIPPDATTKRTTSADGILRAFHACYVDQRDAARIQQLTQHLAVCPSAVLHFMD